MFNLLMFFADWTSGEVDVPMDRIFEYTEPHIIEQFGGKDRPRLDLLKTMPCLFCGEGTANQPAYVGQIHQANIVGRDVHLEVGIDAEVPPLQNSVMYANRADLHMPDKFEFSRNHWAVKDVDLYRFLLRNVRPRRQYPVVFRIHEHENIDPALASVMMPFDAEFNDVYVAIQRASDDAGLHCQRADDIWENPAIIQDVVSLIDRSRVVICDCTGRNPNVFYEAGIAHTLGREVILTTQSKQDIPFDLQHLRYVHYHNNAEGRTALAETLQRKMQSLIAD